MDNIDISKLLDTLSKMDKKDLEAGISKANAILKSKGTGNTLNQNNTKK